MSKLNMQNGGRITQGSQQLGPMVESQYGTPHTYNKKTLKNVRETKDLSKTKDPVEEVVAGSTRVTAEPEFTMTPMTEKEAESIINNFYKTLIEDSYEKIPEDYRQIINNDPDKIKIPESNINYSEADYPKVEKICESLFDKLTSKNKEKLNTFLKENALTDADFITKIEYYTMLNLGDEQETGEQYFNIKYFFETYDGVIPKGETDGASRKQDDSDDDIENTSI